ncbi:MAG: tRNA 2-thiouridine(34) synthase MnmA, partial [Planctomycetaceae bacterium]|nr:tRNA 2-thiouridine(34) synthase MnmA [Planctomycetaceae bacterium]
MSRVLLAMSGGVDSSVSAWLLREQGHEVIGLFMRHGQDLPSSLPGHFPQAGEGRACAAAAPQTEPVRCSKQGCCTAADADDARRVADMLGIPFYAVNFQSEFDRIVDYFVAEYAAGRTPNPCIVCNTWLKFGRLFDYADRLGAEYVATGHYARLAAADGEAALLCGLDASKDQSYVLFGIDRSLLPRLMFPVGEHRKEEIRQIAERLGLWVATKRDSQEICFVPDQDHARFVRERRGGISVSGDIVTSDGTVVGHHDGIEQFTIGQRKGLRVAFGQPRYVIRIDPES